MLCNTMLRLPQNAQRWLCDRLFASLLISPSPSVKTEVDWAFVMVVGSSILRSFWSVGSYCILMQNAFYFGILRLRPWIISSTLRTWPAYVCMTVHGVCIAWPDHQTHIAWSKLCRNRILAGLVRIINDACIQLNLKLQASNCTHSSHKWLPFYKALTMVYRTAEGTQIPTKVMCWCKVIGKSTFYDMFGFEAWNST